MANTYSLLASTVLTGSQASVTFSSIPQNYTDLVLKYSARDDSGNTSDATVYLTFNNDSGNNYSYTMLRGSGSAAATARASSQANFSNGTGVPGSGATANTFSYNEIYIPNYISTTSKPISLFDINETNATAAYIWNNAGLYSGTSAITSIKLASPTNNFVSGSSFYLYGISKS